MSQTPTATHRPIIENLEHRRLLDASGVLAGKTDVRFIIEDDGTRANRDTVVVNFTDAVNVDPAASFGPGTGNFVNVVGYGVNPISGRQKKILTPVSDVRVNPDDPRQLLIDTGTITDQFSRIYIYGDAVVDANGDNIEVLPGEENVITQKGASKWRFTLAQRQFRPFVNDYFESDVFAAAAEPNAGTEYTEDEYLGQLLFVLRERQANFGTVSDAQIAEAEARYTSDVGRGIFPDPALRAGLLSLYGTVAEPVIGAYLDGENETGARWRVVAFADFEGDAAQDVEVAETVIDEGRLRTLVKNQFRGEFFTAYGALLAHEALHTDFVNTQQEEIITNTVETMVWHQQLEVYPIAGRTQTALVNHFNTDLLAMYNSGNRQYPRVGLTNAPLEIGQSVYVNDQSQPVSDFGSFENAVRAEYANRGFDEGQPPMSPLAQTIIENITGVSREQFTNRLFSEGIIDLIDLEQDVISDPGAVLTAGELKLIYFAV